MSRILFSPESFNMGETTRCIEIARVARERGHTVLFHVYSPKYLGLLESAGLPVHLREPIMSDAEAEQIMAKNMYLRGMTEEDVAGLCEEDIELVRGWFRDWKKVKN